MLTDYVNLHITVGIRLIHGAVGYVISPLVGAVFA